MKNKKNIPMLVIAILMLWTSVSSFSVLAANNTDLNQTITAGSLSTDVRDASRVAVSNPAFTMSSTSFSFNCQTTTSSIGSDSQRIYVDNPDGADSGWTLTAAVTSGVTSLWENSGATQTFDFNDPTASGCTDGADADTKGGQLTLNPAASTLTTDCASCATTSITKGSSAAYSQGVTDSITLLTAAAGSDDIGRWYLTGVGASQSIPAEQPVETYDINLTITATAS
jgi:hypothetical protein